MGARLSPFAASWLVALVLGAVACGIFALALSRARAQEPPAVIIAFCGEYREFAERLKKRFNEEPVARGQVSPTTLLVVFASPGGKTFTVLRVTARGKACVVTSGEGWGEIAPTAEGEGL